MGQNKIRDISQGNDENNLPLNTEENPIEKLIKKPKKKKTRSKKYQSKAKIIKKKTHTLDEALNLLNQISYASFDPTVELHFNLSIDPKKSDQTIRQTINLPHGIKKDIKTLVFGNEEQLKEAKSAGATYIGNDETITKIKNGWIDFDKVITSPEMMPKITVLAKILGPKGLMPNIKNNTITTNFKSVISDLISGTSIELRNQKDFPLVHTLIGKLSFDIKKLEENFIAVYTSILRAKPVKVKPPYIKSISIKTTMSPGIYINLNSLESILTNE